MVGGGSGRFIAVESKGLIQLVGCHMVIKKVFMIQSVATGRMLICTPHLVLQQCIGTKSR